jgi:uncharacterized phage protein (TIGR01671 family)
MREIKFRAFDDGKMVLQINTILTNEMDQLSWFFKSIRKDSIVMQFTGLQDKNGKEIYEGDLLKVYDNRNGYLQVEFVNAYVGGWVLTHPESVQKLSLGARAQNTIEVIGNIYENPELLS